MRNAILAGLSGIMLVLAVLAPSNLLVAQEANSIDICCAWNKKIIDGDLTYKISGGDGTAQQTVRYAIEEWDLALTGITLTEVSGTAKADIDVKFKNGGGRIAGQALRKFDSNGFINSVQLTISGKAFGTQNNIDTVAQITKHEMGHALGLGHANFDGDLMSTTVQAGTGIISNCDINGVIAANHWQLVDNVTTPHSPHVDHIPC